MAEISVLLADQKALAGLISRSVANLNKLGKDRQLPNVISSRLGNLNNYWERFQLQHARLESLADDELRKDAYFTGSLFHVTAEEFDLASDHFSVLLQKKSPPLLQTSQSSSSFDIPFQANNNNNNSSLKLRINLPKFNGNYKEWSGFRDLFIALVHDRQGLTDAERMIHLKTNLTDEAANVIKLLQPTAANYNTAWELIKNRFENKRYIVTSYLQEFLDIPNVKNNTLLKDLKNLRNKLTETRASLLNLERAVDQWDDLFIHLIIKKLDNKSISEWELNLGNSSELPTFKQLSDFLDTRVRNYESINMQFNSSNCPTASTSTTSNNNKTKVKVHQTTANVRVCTRCEGNHPLYLCYLFKRDSVENRRVFCTKNKLCYNCLRSGHLSAQCTSKFTCNTCKNKHHSLLHQAKVETREQKNDVPSSSETNQNVNAHSLINSVFSTNSLATAMVRISSMKGRSILVRALLDPGSQVSCLSDRVVKLLRLKKQKVSVNLSGVGDTPASDVTYAVSFTLNPVDSDQPSIEVEALMLTSISRYYAPFSKSNDDWPELISVKLADPTPCDGKPIDCLLGVREFNKILLDGMYRKPELGLLAQETIFGWIISGQACKQAVNKSFSQQVHHFSLNDTLDVQLRQFWELEEPIKSAFSSPEDAQCEKLFMSKTRREKDGKYVVSLPFKEEGSPQIGETFKLAERIFLRNEARLLKNEALYNQYQQFLQEYLDLGHMVRSDISLTRPQGTFLTHLPVIRAESKTTKLRVVFNASLPSSNGKSLNDLLLTGRKLLVDLPELIMKWRSYRYVYIADLTKMFRQIWVEPDNCRYQQILWRPTPNEPLAVYRLTTVMYGTSCAPFLASRVLQQLAEDEGEHFPLAKTVLLDNFYVDDALFGSYDKDLLRQCRLQLQGLLKAGGFTPRKWASNCPDLLSDISSEEHGLAIDNALTETDSLKVLGIKWNPTSDSFAYAFQSTGLKSFTKRKFLSLVARMYDPLGWVAPLIVAGKIIIQLLWLHKVDLDETLPSVLNKKCVNFQEQLSQVQGLNIPRWLGLNVDVHDIEIHGFSDASKLAYAAVVYLRIVLPDQSVSISLLKARTKVAPIKKVSMPKLELCGAELLCKTIRSVKNALPLNYNHIYCWTDAKDILYWLLKPPNKLPIFEANRTSYIQTNLPEAIWRHVPGSCNPADCASRGISIAELKSHPLWWQGPAWLRQSPEHWPKTLLDFGGKDTDETVVKCNVFTNEIRDWLTIRKFSSWMKLVRVLAYVRRFADACRPPGIDYKDLALGTKEISSASDAAIRAIQRLPFALEIDSLAKKKPINSKSSLLSLSPILRQGILRVGGRLSNADLTETRKHPAIIPKGQFGLLLLQHFHKVTLHGGVQVTLRVLREQFWVISARSMARTVIANCVVCVRMRAKTQTQIMGDLPAVRLTQTRLFQYVGLDYAGPLKVRLAKGRGNKSQKCYVAIFVCLTVRAMHLELVSDYSTQMFLAAFERFVARRGMPSRVLSDNGTNFKGAQRELAENYRQVISDIRVKDFVATKEIQWEFIPPNAPHYGGIWEAGVKSMKHHLHRVIGDFTPTSEEFQTLLCKIEAVLNSRPLAPLYDNPDCFDVLTPGHFLVGSLLTAPPTPSILDMNLNCMTRWQVLQEKYERFWRIWASDYLNSLQKRGKWRVEQPNLKVNDVVLIRDRNVSPGKWLMGRVVEVITTLDGHVRKVRVKTAHSSFERHINQLCLLPVQGTLT